MTKLIRVFVACFFFAFAQSQPLFAWNALGHMVIADIAYQNIDTDVRQKLNDLMKYFNQEYPGYTSYMQAAPWPDLLRVQKVEMFTHWHYIDLPFSEDNTPLKNLVDTDNGVWAINTMQHAIANQYANAYERARFIVFITHIVGDLHQPLHTVSRISAKHPDGDLGGNLFLVKAGRKRSRLHKVWDDGIGLFKAPASEENAHEMAKSLMARYPQTYFGARVKDLHPESWAAEGMNNAQAVVYKTEEDRGLAQGYITEAQHMVEEEVTLSGYRLAAMLNQMLGTVRIAPQKKLPLPE
jgi:hypothetical protein